jgi:NAD(P)-dependent dehydrogenase (short-subunit alcohol dehydrogenase family)
MILDRFRLDGKIAVVTGGTKGIGKAIAVALAEVGADIAIVSRTPHPDIEKSILNLGRRYTHHSADLTERTQTRSVIPAVMKKMGDLDILVNNAGIIRRSPAIEHPEEDWDDTLESDLSGSGSNHAKEGKGEDHQYCLSSVIPGRNQCHCLCSGKTRRCWAHEGTGQRLGGQRD